MARGTKTNAMKIVIVMDLLYDEIQLRHYTRTKELVAEDRTAINRLINLLQEERISLK